MFLNKENIVRSIIILIAAAMLAACSSLIVNNKYAADAQTIPAVRLPAGMHATGVKSQYPVPTTSVAGNTMPDIYPPG
jgi:uncharacterized lipoprotein